MINSTTAPTIAASEDMDYLYVRADERTRDQAVEALVHQAQSQWGQHVDRALLPTPVALWYKVDGETLRTCLASDPDADSRWWVFADVPAQAVDHD